MLVNNTNATFRINLTKIIGGVAVFLSLIPWFRFGLFGNGSGSMPWPFIGYLLFFLSFKTPIIKTPKNFTVFLIVLICGISVALFVSYSVLNENTFRSLYNYLSVAVIYLGFFNYLIRYGFPMHIFIYVNILWLLFALLELFMPEIALNFSAIRTQSGRGVTSLANEPTFFGMYLFFSSWLMFVGSNYKPGKYLMSLIFLNIIFIFFIAKASMIIIYLLLTVLVFFTYAFIRLRWKKNSLKLTAIFGALAFVGGVIINYGLESSRYLSMLNRLLKGINLHDLFFNDASLNNRLEHIVYSTHGAVKNLLIPSGFDAFFHFKAKLDIIYDYYFWYGQPTNKIMSWNGDWLFQLGFFGIIFVGYLFYSSSDGSRMKRAELFLLVILLFSAIPIAFPLIPMLLALYTYIRRIRANDSL